MPRNKPYRKRVAVLDVLGLVFIAPIWIVVIAVREWRAFNSN